MIATILLSDNVSQAKVNFKMTWLDEKQMLAIHTYYNENFSRARIYIQYYIYGNCSIKSLQCNTTEPCIKPS
jgi:hypothetical protein